MKRGTPAHPKVRHLARLLGVRRYAAVGLLESLWHFAMRYAPTGNIGKFTNEAIVEELDWEGPPEKLIQALVEAGWLRRCAKNRLLIHDWQDHADQTVRRYLAAHSLTFASHTPMPASKNASKNDNGVSDPDSPPLPLPVPEPEPVGVLANTLGGNSRPPYDEIVDAWNAMAKTHKLPRIRSLNEARRKAVRGRWRDKIWRQDWQAAINEIPNSQFRLGNNDRKWRANIDWFLRPNTVATLVENASSDPQAKDRDLEQNALSIIEMQDDGTYETRMSEASRKLVEKDEPLQAKIAELRGPHK